MELLFNDQLVLVVGKASRWARRRKLILVNLTEARWIRNSPASWGTSLVDEVFRAEKLPLPRAALRTLSVSLRNHLLSRGDFVIAMPGACGDQQVHTGSD